MLSIPHLPFTRIRLSRLRLSAQDLVGSMLASLSRTTDKVIARLQRKFPHLSRRVLLSVFVVLIGFFGSLAAFVGLKPIINHGIGNPGPAAERANVSPSTTTSPAAPSTPATDPAPVATQPAPAQVVQPAQPVASSPVAPSPSSAPVISSAPTTSVLEPGRGSVAPAPTTTTTTPTVSPTPTTTTPTTDPVQSTVDGVQQTLNTTTQPVTDPVLNTTTKLLN